MLVDVPQSQTELPAARQHVMWQLWLSDPTHAQRQIRVTAEYRYTGPC